MSLKLEFVEKATQPGAKLAPLCREYGISRQTGTKWVKRFKQEGYAGLEERSRRPRSSPLSLAEELVMAVLELRDRHSSWGPRKLRGVLERRFGESTPSVATIARILRRAGVVRAKRRRKPLSVVDKAPRVAAGAPNDVWTIDFKGWWRTHDGSRCEPLTVRDAYSRYLLAMTLLPATTGEAVRVELERLFKKHGLPSAFQCDNGSPFISTRGRGGFTQLSAWWAALGIRIVRSRPGCPQDNGGHERMHRDVAKELQHTPSSDTRAQQRELDRWRQEFNHVRPHEALGNKTPAEVYTPSQRKLQATRPFPYPAAFTVRRVDASGHVYWQGEHCYIGTAFGGHRLGFEPQDGLRWKLWFRDIDLGLIELLPDWFDDVALDDPKVTAQGQKKNNNKSKKAAA
jgi:transposase InsO family protein